jgi:hypothetical protein
MPTPPDFRTQPLAWNSISECGRYVGCRTYWRLYAIENILRIIAHSVLSVQINPAWLSVTLTHDQMKKIQKMKADYHSQPHRANPGNHDIYYLYLPQLTKIVSLQAGLFMPKIPDIDAWILRLESIRLPRNIVSHMNWPNAVDSQDIDALYLDLRRLYLRLQESGLVLLVP